MTRPAPSPPLSPFGPVVAGYRLDELIGVGESANVYAGMLDVGGGTPGVAGSDPVALKLCLASGIPSRRDDPSFSGIRSGGSGGVGIRGDEGAFAVSGRAAECRALALRPIAAMPRLLDLATTDRGELLLVMTLCRGRPAESRGLRAETPAVDAGELTRLVGELHEAGVAHGGLDPGAVLVDDDGVHSLVGFRSARFVGDHGFSAAIGADLRAVAALARGRPVLVSFPHHSSTGGAASPQDPGWSPVRAAPSPGVPLTPRPTAVQTHRGARGSRVDASASASASHGASGRRGGAAWRRTGVGEGVVGSPVVAAGSRDRAVAAVGPHDSGERELDGVDDAWGWVDDRAEEPGRELAFLETLEPAVLALRESGAALRGLVGVRATGVMAPRRRRILVAGGALVVAATVAGCLLIPANDSNTAPSAIAAATATGTAERTPRVAATDAGSDAAREAAQDAAQDAAESDDPVRAASALLERRQRCLLSAAPRCLDAVDQWNSPALLADQELARASPQPDDPLASITGVELVERIGATALLQGTSRQANAPETTKPVSLLVMRGETGWRIRSYRVGSRPD